MVVEISVGGWKEFHLRRIWVMKGLLLNWRRDGGLLCGHMMVAAQLRMDRDIPR